MSTLTEKYNEAVALQEKDAEAIRTATNYAGEYLIWGSTCDSSARHRHRMEYVKEAEAQFIEANKKAILSLAADLCLKDI